MPSVRGYHRVLSVVADMENGTNSSTRLKRKKLYSFANFYFRRHSQINKIQKLAKNV